CFDAQAPKGIAHILYAVNLTAIRVMSLFFTQFCPGGECAENRFDYRKTLVLQGLRHDFLHTFGL
ncbi:hypothetical protein HMPREF3208_00302, partial [Gardnerella vaginalis]